MNIGDEAAIANQRLWEEEAKKGCGFTIPWLNLDVSLLRKYARGELERLPEPLACLSLSRYLRTSKAKTFCAWHQYVG